MDARRKVVILALLLSGCTNAQLYKTSSSLLLADWSQTRYIATHSEYEERNPILGKNPTRGEVDLYFAGWLAANTAAYYLLPEKVQPYWFWPLILVETGAIVNNASIGVGFNVGF